MDRQSERGRVPGIYAAETRRRVGAESDPQTDGREKRHSAAGNGSCEEKRGPEEAVKSGVERAADRTADGDQPMDRAESI